VAVACNIAQRLVPARPVFTSFAAYNSHELAQWAERISQWLKQRKQVHVYFDNDAECAAPLNALELKKLFQKKS
jgi:uncharacterized protein YecE (DUF72 family)